jgi:hypothetical protein
MDQNYEQASSGSVTTNNPGLEYCVIVHVSLADLSKYAIDNIGIHFSDEQITLDKKGDIIFNNKAELSELREYVEMK